MNKYTDNTSSVREPFATNSEYLVRNNFEQDQWVNNTAKQAAKLISKQLEELESNKKSLEKHSI